MAFTSDEINRIWNKGIVVDGYDPALVRKDACGAWIIKNQYDRPDSEYCWEIDHIYPQSKLQEKGYPQNMIDHEDNLRPMHRRNNESKSNNYPNYKASVTSDGEHNVDKTQEFTVNQNIQQILSDLYR